MKLAEIEDALLEAVRTAPQLAYLKTVEPISDRSFDFTRGDFLVVPPAVLSFFLGAQLRSRDLAARTYDYTPRLLLFALARNLRGVAAEKLGGPTLAEVGAYQMLHDLKTTLAGLRLGLAGSTPQPQLELVGEALEAVTADFSVYSLELLARGTFHA